MISVILVNTDAHFFCSFDAVFIDVDIPGALPLARVIRAHERAAAAARRAVAAGPVPLIAIGELPPAAMGGDSDSFSAAVAKPLSRDALQACDRTDACVAAHCLSS